MIPSLITMLFTTPEGQAALTLGVGWLVKKVLGKRADTKLGKATQAATTSAAIMAQMALSEPNKTEKEMIAAFKGVIAIQFAQAGFTEEQRKPYQGLIDLTIAKAVEQWVKHHPKPSTLTMPIWAKLATTTAITALK